MCWLERVFHPHFRWKLDGGHWIVGRGVYRIGQYKWERDYWKWAGRVEVIEGGLGIWSVESGTCHGESDDTEWHRYS